jgi:hypothetical protein
LEGQHDQKELIQQHSGGGIWHGQYPGGHQSLQSEISMNFQGC